MKKSLFILTLLLLAGSVAVMAQGGGPRMSIEDRVKRVHQKIDSAFKLEPAKMVQVDSVFSTYYHATDKVRQDMTAGGGQPDFQAMREKTQPLRDARDKELKTLLGDANYQKWKDEIEPTMRPGGGGGGNR